MIGEKASIDFPSVNATQAGLAGFQGGLVMKLNPRGDASIYYPCLGGSGPEIVYAVAVE